MSLHLLVKWEVVSPNSRWGQLESISIISSIPLFWFCISNVGWFGGVIFFSHFMLFPTFLEKKSWNTNQLFLIYCFLRVFRSTGPIAVARRRSVCLSVCLSVNTSNSATNVWIFFKIGGNIPWVNISRRFFHFKKFQFLNFFLI